ncbi:hypothetical protein [Roseivivax sp. CAU 1761]
MALDYDTTWMEAALEDFIEFSKANGLPATAEAIRAALTTARRERKEVAAANPYFADLTSLPALGTA